jgi:hypothetical protein
MEGESYSFPDSVSRYVGRFFEPGEVPIDKNEDLSHFIWDMGTNVFQIPVFDGKLMKIEDAKKYFREKNRAYLTKINKAVTKWHKQSVPAEKTTYAILNDRIREQNRLLLDYLNTVDNSNLLILIQEHCRGFVSALFYEPVRYTGDAFDVFKFGYCVACAEEKHIEKVMKEFKQKNEELPTLKLKELFSDIRYGEIFKIRMKDVFDVDVEELFDVKDGERFQINPSLLYLKDNVLKVAYSLDNCNHRVFTFDTAIYPQAFLQNSMMYL